MLKTAPSPKDVQEFQFKLRSRFKVFHNSDKAPFEKNCNLLAAASRFGLIFIGTPSSNLQVLQVDTLSQWSKSDEDKSDYPYREVPLPSPPKYLCINCEHTVLAVVLEKNGCPVVQFYDVRSFWSQNIVHLEEARLSPTPGVSVLEVNWNPAIGSVFTACKSDGSLGVYELKNPGIDINELPAAAGATSFCWSPKGKQIAVGSRDGRITQYKPDLKAVKMINAPPLTELHLLLSLQWVSNYQFIGVYQPLNPDSPACLIVVDAPKTGDPIYTNYDDICYSNGTTRPPQFYMIFQQTWNVLMVASANSMEVGVMGFTGDTWTQWIMGDAARAELPLSEDRQDTLPVGLGLDISSTQAIAWDDSSLPPVPLLLLLSHYGTLCCFNVINLNKGIPTICTPSDPISDKTGLQSFTIKSPPKTPKQEQPQASATQNIPQAVNLAKPKAAPTVPLIVPKVSFGFSPSPAVSTPPSMAGPQPSLFAPKPQQPTQGVPLFGGEATSTSQAPAPSTSSPSILSLLQSSAKIAPPTTPAPISAPSNFGTPINKTGLIPKPAEVPPPIKEPTKPEIPDVIDDAETEALFCQMVKDECVFIETELKALLRHGRSLKINLGSDADKTSIVERTTALEEFFKEVVDISVGQSAEVHSLKQSLFESWAFFDEAKKAHLASTDKSMSMILRSKPLDSASEKQLDDIKHAIYYLESQMSQANKCLDEQWDKFQDFCRKTHRVQMPTMEAIFQTLVKQTAIIQKQSYMLRDIGNKIKVRSRAMAREPLVLSMDSADKLEEQLRRLQLQPNDICDMKYQHVINRTKCLTKKKSESIRNFLRNRDFPHISVIKPQLNSSSMVLASPSCRSRLSMLEAKFSPVLGDNKLVKKLEFVQSTPKIEPKKMEAPMESLQNFAHKFETSHLIPKNVPAPFAGINKVLPSGPNSAFVSTTFGASTPVTGLAVSKPVTFGVVPSATVSRTIAPTFSLGGSLTTTTMTSSNQPVISISSNNLIGKPFQINADVTITPLPKTTSAPPVAKSSLGGTKSAFSLGQQSSATPVVAVSTAVSSKLATTSMFSFTAASNAVKTPFSAPSSIFGNATTTPSSVFGTATTGADTKPTQFANSGSSLFGAPPSASTPSTESSASKFSFGAQLPTTNAPTFVTPSTTSAVAAKQTESKSVATGQPVSFTTTPATLVAPKATLTSVVPTQPSSPVVTTTSKPSIFGAFAATTGASGSILGGPPQTSIFAPAVSTTSTSTTSVATPAFVTVGLTPTTIVTTSTIPQSSIFAPTVSTTTPATKPISTFVPVQGSAFGGTSESVVKPVFGAIPSPASGAAVTSSPIFAGSTAAPKTSIFGGATATPPPFGSGTITPSTTSVTTTTVTSPPSAFGAAFSSASSPSKPSVFGSSASTTSASSQPIFGASIFGTTGVPSATATTTTSTTQSIFGAAVSTSSQPSIFGGATNTQPSGFEEAQFRSTTAATPSVFGGAATSTSPFGVVSSSAAPFGGVSVAPPAFGAVTSTSTPFGAATFGTPSTTTSAPFGLAQTATSGVFGQATPAFAATAGSSFGAPSVFGAQTAGSLFASAATTSSGSIFGSTPTTSSAFGGSGGSVFGAAPAAVVSGSSPFGAVSSQPSSSFSFAAAATNTGSGSFGFGGLNVGSNAPTSTSSFGFGQTSAPNPFGGAATQQEQKGPFGGGDGKSLFGGSVPASSSGSIFGPPSSGATFGSSSAFGGGGSTFGAFGQQQQPQTAATFGQGSFTGASTFGSSQPGPFSGGAGSVSQSGFGSSPSFQKPSGFGASPGFGANSPAAFGAGPSFGGSPAFGNTPAFGSPSKVFGGGAPNVAFGSPGNVQNSSFGNLANQPTVGFGNLAQQGPTGQSGNAPFSGNTSFSSWR